MTDNRLEELLRETDSRMEVNIPDSGAIIETVRHRAARRAAGNKIIKISMAAMVLIACCWSTTVFLAGKSEQRKIATLQADIAELKAGIDATVKLIDEVLARQDRIERLEKLEAQLAAIPDPLEQIQQQVDKTAFRLVYQADMLYKQLNSKDKESAIEKYNQVIELFGTSQWAQVAKERLAGLENENHIENGKGEVL